MISKNINITIKDMAKNKLSKVNLTEDQFYGFIEKITDDIIAVDDDGEYLLDFEGYFTIMGCVARLDNVIHIIVEFIFTKDKNNPKIYTA